MKTIKKISQLAGCLLVLFIVTTTATKAQVHTDIFQLVLKSDYMGISDAILKGEDVNRMTNVGNTALMSAAKVGDYQVIKALLDNKADVNIQNKAGATALMIAAKYGHPHVITELLKHGADPKIKNNQGFRAANFALGYKHLEVYDQLKKAEDKSIAFR